MWVRRVAVRGEVVEGGEGVVLLSLPPEGGKMADAMVGCGWVVGWMGVVLRGRCDLRILYFVSGCNLAAVTFGRS